eukprot:scaffold633_cov105-Pinguiococcus_pyrenoidosus.AAC.1
MAGKPGFRHDDIRYTLGFWYCISFHLPSSEFPSFPPKSDRQTEEDEDRNPQIAEYVNAHGGQRRPRRALLPAGRGL